jgi:hypothetical protein
MTVNDDAPSVSPNGLGAVRERDNNFLVKRAALFAGSISREACRRIWRR